MLITLIVTITIVKPYRIDDAGITYQCSGYRYSIIIFTGEDTIYHRLRCFIQKRYRLAEGAVEDRFGSWNIYVILWLWILLLLKSDILQILRTLLKKTNLHITRLKPYSDPANSIYCYHVTVRCKARQSKQCNCTLLSEKNICGHVMQCTPGLRCSFSILWSW